TITINLDQPTSTVEGSNTALPTSTSTTTITVNLDQPTPTVEANPNQPTSTSTITVTVSPEKPSATVDSNDKPTRPTSVPIRESFVPTEVVEIDLPERSFIVGRG